MTTPKRNTRSKSDDGGVSALLSKMKTEIIQATQLEIRKETAKIMEKLSNLDDRINKVETSLSLLTSKHNMQDERISDLSRRLDEMRKSVGDGMYVEIQDRIKRSKNIVISGISEHTGGSIEERHEKDLNHVNIILQTLHADVSKTFTVNRIGKIKPNSNRLIRVTLPSEEEASKVLRSAKSLKSHKEFGNVFMNPDRTLTQRLQFAELRRECRARRESGEDVVIFGGRVVVRDTLKRENQQNFH